MRKKQKKRALLLHDKGKGPFYIEELRGINYFLSLLDMYFHFTPRPVAQGLPPQDNKSCVDWLIRLLAIGINFIAIRPEGKTIGHVALLPSKDMSEAEFMVFVHQDHRQLGIGTALTTHAIEEARHHGIKRLWLCVSPTNIPAIKLYLKVGFEFKRKDLEECLMEIWVNPP